MRNLKITLVWISFMIFQISMAIFFEHKHQLLRFFISSIVAYKAIKYCQSLLKNKTTQKP